MRILIGAKPQKWDPRFAVDAFGMKFSDLIFQSLVTLDHKLQVAPSLAYKWEQNQKNLKFWIKSHTQFSDELKLSCEDLIFSIEAYQKKEVPFKLAFKNIQNPKCTIDPKTTDLILSFSLLKSPIKFLRADLPVLKVLPKAVFNTSEKLLPTQLIGTGPYILDSLTDSKILLKAKDPQLHIPYLDFLVAKDPFTKYLKIHKQKIDLAIDELPPIKILSLKRNAQFDIIETEGLSTNYLLLNLRDPELKKFHVRQKLHNAIPREKITRLSLEGLAHPAFSLLNPSNPYYVNLDPTSIPHSTEGKPDHIMPSFEIKTSQNSQVIQNMKILIQELKPKGFEFTLKSYDWGTFFKDIKKGNFQIASMRWVGVFDPDIHGIAFHSKEFPPGRNRGHYANKNVDILLEKAEETLDPNERIALYQEVQKQIFADYPIIPLWRNTLVAVKHKRIEQFILDPQGSFRPLLKTKIKR